MIQIKALLRIIGISPLEEGVCMQSWSIPAHNHTTMGCCSVLKAIFTRLLFAIHSVTAVFLVTRLMKSIHYWLLCSALLGLFIEMLITLIKRKGQEWKWYVQNYCYIEIFAASIQVLFDILLNESLKNYCVQINPIQNLAFVWFSYIRNIWL